ncbi:Ferredoxin-like protein FixX [Moorella thermoacetica]|uniref:Ferredoxin-like protein n=2 Tax=Neomoorella thermoacetica TaxID=1525 RepID=A0A1D7X6M2_NEOTH|nr:4Fe-4S dicluster domain-containing protein [Moorella thermoacetica]AOQ22560.1 putative oxidoreductase Fe-S binding subunit [Moorella thermoacetica]OIQ10246.1 ferredoxin-like protein FixX [Moorella thermoacetica]OIQ11927.1 ferredoxin-like protein FixX [Moorella thermoacetica]OIQ62294.1 ferredoxin-like protein FixX [Moorella thermoacetica]TYL13195.1 Ferredoxin-like protein FixX [Moorella thermoacetica]
MRLEDKLFLNRYQTDKHPHLRIKDREVCRHCEGKPCTFICPARVYVWNEREERIETAYEGCVECGTCRYGCAHDNIDWRNPRGGFGILYKYG